MKRYVLGFLFSEDREKVVLIHKLKPDFQKGKLNGIGGKIEKFDSSPLAAMEREFEEEAGIKISNWNCFAILSETEWNVECFRAFGDISGVETKTDEIVSVVNVSELNDYFLMDNLKWLIPLALDGQVFHAAAIY